MAQRVKLFVNGRSQAVRLPAAFRFDTDVVYIRRDAASGDVTLSRRPSDWRSFFEAVEQVDDDGFLSSEERGREPSHRDPLAGLT